MIVDLDRQDGAGDRAVVAEAAAPVEERQTLLPVGGESGDVREAEHEVVRGRVLALDLVAGGDLVIDAERSGAVDRPEEARPLLAVGGGDRLDVPALHARIGRGPGPTLGNELPLRVCVRLGRRRRVLRLLVRSPQAELDRDHLDEQEEDRRRHRFDEPLQLPAEAHTSTSSSAAQTRSTSSSSS